MALKDFHHWQNLEIHVKHVLILVVVVLKNLMLQNGMLYHKLWNVSNQAKPHVKKWGSSIAHLANLACILRKKTAMESQPSSPCVKCRGFPFPSANGDGVCRTKSDLKSKIPPGDAYCLDGQFGYFTTDCKACNADGVEKAQDGDNLCSPKASASKIMVVKK